MLTAPRPLSSSAIQMRARIRRRHGSIAPMSHQHVRHCVVFHEYKRYERKRLGEPILMTLTQQNDETASN